MLFIKYERNNHEILLPVQHGVYDNNNYPKIISFINVLPDQATRTPYLLNGHSQFSTTQLFAIIDIFTANNKLNVA